MVLAASDTANKFYQSHQSPNAMTQQPAGNQGFHGGPNEGTLYVASSKMEHTQTSEQMETCIHDTDTLLLQPDVKHAVFQVGDHALTMHTTCHESLAGSSILQTCSLDFTKNNVQYVCAGAAGIYTHTNNSVICMVGSTTANSEDKNSDYLEQQDQAPEQQHHSSSADVVVFDLINVPDCLATSCTNVDHSVFETKLVHHYAAVLTTRLSAPDNGHGTTFPFLHQTGQWICQVGLQGTNAHLVSQMHETYLDAKANGNVHQKIEEHGVEDKVEPTDEDISESTLRGSTSSHLSLHGLRITGLVLTSLFISLH